MAVKWTAFAAAAVLAALVMLPHGAPLGAVLLGAAAVALGNFLRRRKAS